MVFPYMTHLLAAMLLGALIGAERQWRQRMAGLRTNALVATGAAVFILSAMSASPDSPGRIAAQIVSGIGFLGAGVIMRDGMNVRGLNTAATLWCSAAVGACCGAGLVVEAIMGSLFVLAANTLLRPIVDKINRQPLDVTSAEVTNSVYVVTRSDRQKEALALLEQELEDRNYPTRDLEVLPFGERNVKIQATLAATSVDGVVMDSIVEHLSALSMVRQAYWSSSTTE